MRSHRLLVAVAATAAALGLAACSSSTATDSTSSAAESVAASAEVSTPASSTPASEAPSAASVSFPLTIEHALGTATIPAMPERVATVNWANHEVPLALGVVPVGMAAANFGDDDADGLLPWVKEKLDELGGEAPVLFDETDGIDFEAVADTKPDVILAGYSGLTQEDYDKLSKIAPVVAYPVAPWATPWRDIIRVNSKGMGQETEGEALIGSIEEQIAAEVAKYPQLAGKNTMFLTHVDTGDLSEVSFYTTNDTRPLFFEDLGLGTPKAVAEASAGGTDFAKTISAEQVDMFDDVDIIVTYGDQSLVDALNADPLLSQMPAVKNGAIVLLGNDPIGTAANPTPLAISWVLADYVKMLADAADKAQ